MVLIPNTAKILNFLLRQADVYNINQLARLLQISVGSAHKIVRALEEKGLLLVRELGNARYYQLNLRNTETIKLCELLLVQQRRQGLQHNKVAKVYSSDLEKYPALAVVLFGSLLARPEQAKDVDVLFLIRKKLEVRKVDRFCLEISKLRTKKVNPLIMLFSDFVANLRNKDKAVSAIVEKGIVLSGEEVFVRGITYARQK